jgi:hypothetical protein
MTDEEIIRQFYHFRTHPFKPTIGPNGKDVELDMDVLMKTLDPYTYPEHSAYFFDFYEWHNERILKGIDKDHGLRHFEKQVGNDPLLIIIAGYNLTGRRSLAKLIMSQIRKNHSSNPIIIEASLTSVDSNLRSRDLANNFVDNYIFEEQEPAEAKLRGLIYEAVQLERVNPGTGFLQIFQRFRTFIRRFCKRPIVFSITGVDNLDGWRKVFEILSPIANYILIITSREDEAKVARDTMLNNFASVTAPKLYLNQAVDFLRMRLSAERPSTLSEDERFSLKPFHIEALEALFASGSARPKEKVGWNIGWVISKLHLAFDEHLRELRQELEKVDNVAAHVPLSKTVINEALIMEYMEADKRNIFPGLK